MLCKRICERIKSERLIEDLNTMYAEILQNVTAMFAKRSNAVRRQMKNESKDLQHKPGHYMTEYFTGHRTPHIAHSDAKCKKRSTPMYSRN